jgi:ABC-2 type transport system permease protein
MNTQAITLNTMQVTARSPVGAYLEEIRCEALRTLRNPGLFIPVMLMPAALYALFALLITGNAIDKDPTLGIFLFAAFSIMATSMAGLFGIGATLAMEREMGLMRLRRAQPAPAGGWLVAKIVCGIGFGVVAYVPIAVLAITTGKLKMDGGALMVMSAVMIASAIPFCAMGLMIGSLVTGSAAPGYANLIYLPGCYLSGMFFPLPESMYWQAPLWPQFHVVQLAMNAAHVTKYTFEPVQMAVAALAGFTVLFSAVAIWRLAYKG